MKTDLCFLCMVGVILLFFGGYFEKTLYKYKINKKKLYNTLIDEGGDIYDNVQINFDGMFLNLSFFDIEKAYIKEDNSIEVFKPGNIYRNLNIYLKGVNITSKSSDRADIITRGRYPSLDGLGKPLH